MDEKRTQTKTIRLELSVDTVATLLTWNRQMCMAMEGKMDEPEQQFMKAANEFAAAVNQEESTIIHKEIFRAMKDRLNEMA